MDTILKEYGARITYEIKAISAGASYIVWTAEDDEGNEFQTYTKVLVTKPISELHFEDEGDSSVSLTVGEGKRLAVIGTKDNTESKELSFSVKGKGMKISKSGYLVATVPGSMGTVTVKSGKIQDYILVRVSDDYMERNIKKTRRLY